MKNTNFLINSLSSAIERNPNNASAYNVRGCAYLGLEQYDSGITDYSTAIKLDPNNALVYNDRGSAYLALKYYDLAKKDFEKFLSLVPEDDQTAVQIKQFLNSLE